MKRGNVEDAGFTIGARAEGASDATGHTTYARVRVCVCVCKAGKKGTKNTGNLQHASVVCSSNCRDFPQIVGRFPSSSGGRFAGEGSAEEC